jgi:site-specific recombinase XerD
MTESLKEFIGRHHSSKAARTYLYYIDAFLVAYPNAEKLEYKDIVDYIEQKKKQYDSYGTVNCILGAVKRYYDYLFHIGRRSDHPCERFYIKQAGRKGIQFQDLFSSQELHMLLNRENRFSDLELRNQVAISLLIYQGLTISELVNLKVQDIDLDQNTVYVKGAERGERRILPLESEQAKLIERYLIQSRANLNIMKVNGLLLTIRGDEISLSGIQGMLKPLRGMFPDRPLNAGTIRQSVIANWLNEKKLPLEDVQMLAGHRWPSSTEKYKRIDVTEQREMINRFHPLQ